MSTSPRQTFFGVSMPRPGRCVLQYYKDYYTPEDTTFTARTVGLGVCCILSTDRFANTVSNETQVAPPSNPRAEPHCQTPGEAQLISTFCKARGSDKVETVKSCSNLSIPLRMILERN
eukprot:Blabericola_migrator_1__7854@NODE_4016_length_1380_cov_9_695354_g2476_i0_p1_GENE_NODE_4016_length_1380_cov_9_695354_g2476_i0NODE_4016_length_1380_cov_9_695354_g2476_i0_p1_ORF_typecomplete_len118_score2_82_NODE_4016_length_1380_cov_9_695354_g2476_i0341694